MTQPVTAITSALIELINAQPRSPTVAELEAVVGRHIPSQPDITPKTLTYAEFETLIKASGKPCDLSKREPPSNDVVVIWSDPIVLFFDPTATRGINGLLPKSSHRAYVVRYDEEQDAIMLHSAEPSAISGLIPGRMAPLWAERNKCLGV